MPSASGSRRSAAATAFAAAAILIAAVLLNLSAIHWRPNLDDDLLFAYCGWRVWRGDVPYVNVFDNKPPGVWYANALGFALFGENTIGGIVLPAAALLATLVAFTLIARAAYGRGMALPAALTAGLLLTHVRFESGANRTETYVAACEALGVCGYLYWLTRGGFGRLFLAGLALGAAPCFKQSGLAAAAACGLHLVWLSVRERRGWRPVAALAAGGAALPLIVVTVLASQGALADAWFAIVTFNRFSFERGDASWVRVDRSLADYWRDLTPQAELFALVLMGAIAALAAKGARVWRGMASRPIAEMQARAPREASPANTMQRDVQGRALHSNPGCVFSFEPRGLGVFWLWLLIGFYLACVSTGRMAYHMAPLLTPLGLVALYPMAALFAGQPLAAALLRPSRVAALATYVYVLLGVGANSLLHAEKCWRGKTSWYAFERKEPEGHELRGAFIRAHTRPDDLIYVWGWSPGTYRFAYRGCPSRFATLEAVSHVAPHGEFIVEGAIRDMLARPPAAFVMSEIDYAGFARSDRSEFAAWLDLHYEMQATLGGMHVFLWRE